MSSPNVANYYIGKGNVYAKVGADPWRHVGNVPEFEITPEVDELEHFSSMAGVRTKDRTVILEKSMTLRILMEEFTAANLALALLGTVDTDTSGREVIDIFAEAEVRAAIKLIGSNAVGNKFMWHFPAVDFIPSGSVSAITDEWGQLEISGEVAAVMANGAFGRLTKLADQGEDYSETLTELLAEVLT
jgi:hypothetical protein